MERKQITGTEATTYLYYAAIAIVHESGNAHLPSRKNTQRINHLSIRLYEQIRYIYIVESLYDQGRLLVQCAEAIQLALDGEDTGFTVTKQSRHWGKQY
jgi:hypothetical protein